MKKNNCEISNTNIIKNFVNIGDNSEKSETIKESNDFKLDFKVVQSVIDFLNEENIDKVNNLSKNDFQKNV